MIKYLPLLMTVVSLSLWSCNNNCDQDLLREVPHYDTADCKEAEDIERCAHEEMLQFMYDNLVYPQEALTSKVEGEVVVQFQIWLDGSTINHTVTQGLGFGCDEEAVRIVRMMTFVPGQNVCGDIIEI